MNDDAEAARSILACAAGVELAVEGVRQSLDGVVEEVRDWAGAPMIVCLSDGALVRAGRHGLDAVLSLRSGLRAGDSLLLAGRLRHVGTDTCRCCDGTRDYVVVDLTHVLLERAGGRTLVDLDKFGDPALELNSGYLRRSEEHLNSCHGEHLRHAAARRAGKRLDAIAAAQVVGLSPAGVELQYVTVNGSDTLPLTFPGVAHSVDELGHCLRWALHPDLC